MHTLRNAIVALLVVSPLLAQPAFAEKNNHAYEKSSDRAKVALTEKCREIRAAFDGFERQADEHAGTKQAEGPASAADEVWLEGHNAGCGWAQ